jgi:hypothetical protein
VVGQLNTILHELDRSLKSLDIWYQILVSFRSL